MNFVASEPVASSGLSACGVSPAARGPLGRWCWAGAVTLLLTTVPAVAQQYPITAAQRSVANEVAQTGVPLSELAPHAPASHTVKRGDTLWAISGMFLRSPWRWPELWGMNLSDIRNPHRIYPGQVLVLDTSSGRALLKVQSDGALPQVRVSPRTRYEALSDNAIPPVSLDAIAPFLAEMLVVDEASFAQAPRIVAAQEGRVLMSHGDRAYARAQHGHGLGDALSTAPGQPSVYRVFRTATPLKDPVTGEVLGHEAQYVGKARLVRGESLRDTLGNDGKVTVENVPATVDIVGAKEEIRIGDRLWAEPQDGLSTFVPRAPQGEFSGQVVSVYGSAVTFAGQNQVVAINLGQAQGLEAGHVLAVLKNGGQLVDRTDASRPSIRLPGERNGLMMVFRVFERVSYALVLDITDGVRVGDRFVNP